MTRIHSNQLMNYCLKLHDVRKYRSIHTGGILTFVICLSFIPCSPADLKWRRNHNHEPRDKPFLSQRHSALQQHTLQSQGRRCHYPYRGKTHTHTHTREGFSTFRFDALHMKTHFFIDMFFKRAILPLFFLMTNKRTNFEFRFKCSAATQVRHRTRAPGRGLLSVVSVVVTRRHP